jgi:two-component system OmpR family sensor kinase
MTKRRPSIAWRLAIGLSAFTGLLWLGAATIAGTVLEHELNEAFDEGMRQSALRLLPLVIYNERERVSIEIRRSEREDHDGDDHEEDHDEPRISGIETEEEYYTYAVLDQNGGVVLAAADAPPTATMRSVPDGFSAVDGRRVFSLAEERSGFSIVVLEKTDHRMDALKASVHALTWPLAALVPLIIGGIWLAIRLAMRPLEALSRDIAKRDRRDLSPLTAIRQPVELKPIAEAVGGLLDRLRNALDAERAFAASSAHELRTPIAGALAQVQRLAIELHGNPSGARVAEIEASLKHLSQLSEKLLQLSRLEAGFAEADGVVELEPIVRLVARDYESSSRTAGRVQLSIDPAARLVAPVNGDAFAIAITNLIENALRHGEADGTVDVIAGPGATVRVLNNGPVVPADVLARLGEPFVRGATTANGTGLGLSITRAILEQTGGRFEVHSPARGRDGGFEAVLAWEYAISSSSAASRNMQ